MTSKAVAKGRVEPACGDPWEPYRPAGLGAAVRITDVRVICTAPDGVRLVVVKVLTTEPGLYGVGCATFTQRPLAVAAALEEYLKPLVIGRDVGDIEDLHQVMEVSSYWHSGPVLNNALSGIDMALWDIKGKIAGMPLYQLLGGRCRRAVRSYVHAFGRDPQEVADDALRLMEQGFQHIRCQVQVPGSSSYGIHHRDTDQRTVTPARLELHHSPWAVKDYCRVAPELFEHLRGALGDEVELIHDVHQRVPPHLVPRLAASLEPYRLFFLEDPFAPEDLSQLRRLRERTSTPIAMGELFVNPAEYVSVVKEGLIDYLRAHISDIGGITTARKLAALCEYSAVRTAWHGPPDASPVAHAAHVHLGISSPSFGIQECYVFPERTREVFPGSPEIRHGCLWPSDLPGLGVDIDEGAAARYPYPPHALGGGWPPIREPDGAAIRS